MKISSTMDLAQLAEHMGDCATEAEARHMRAALEGIGAWERIEDVPEDEWLKLLDGAVAQAKHDEEAGGFEVGDRVEAGQGDDHDTGTIERIDGGTAFVSWDSGVKTPASVRHLSAI